MIDVYFVRHGETGGNIAKRHQQEDTHLTPLGREQAKDAAAKVAKLKPTHFYVSQRVRAIQTGQAIAEAINMIPDSDPLFVELKRPDSIYGHFHRSVKTMTYLLSWWTGKVGGDDMGSDGESYPALIKRIKAAKEKLESHPDGSRVVVVSHTVFISMYVAHMNDLRPLSFLKALKAFFQVKNLKNGSITQLKYQKESNSWSLVGLV